MADSQRKEPSCVYCEKSHPSSSCTALTNIDDRKGVLRKAGRCYVCLRKHHLSRNCRSGNSCVKCGGRHHISLCQRSTTSSPSQSQGATPVSTESTVPRSGNTDRTTNTMCVDSQIPVLLQTAKLQLYNLQDTQSTPVASRAILDSGSQRTYVTSRVREMLRLPVDHTEALCIRTFGSSGERIEDCEVVEMGLCRLC